MSEIARILDQIPRAHEGKAWHGPALRGLAGANRALRDAIARFDEARLDLKPGANVSTAYAYTHGTIQHALHHAGQIAVPKKGRGR